MSSAVSPRLNLPYIAPAQAQKHVTHNEALTLLDVLAQLHVLSFDAQTPPDLPEEGDAYALGADPTGVWSGQGGQLAVFTNTAWIYLTPVAGWYATDPATSVLRIHDGTTWQGAVGATQNLEGIGIGTSWDATNRLTVTSEASLFTHAGGSHQMKVNKAAPADTASLLFQTGFSGRAEMGLAGDDDFAVKVSADGGTWTNALTADAATGNVTMPRIASGILEVGENAVGLIVPPSTGGFIMLHMSDDQYPQNSHSGFLAYDVGTSLNLTTMVLGSGVKNLGTVALTGTTGTAGDSSISVATGQIQIENRFNGTRRYSYLFLCGE